MVGPSSREKTTTRRKLRQPGDSKTYQELTRSEMDQRLDVTLAEKEKLVVELNRKWNISLSEVERLRTGKFHIPAFYLLPKIQKEKREDTGTLIGRPIFAAITWQPT